MKNIHIINGNIYITNSEEIKEGDDGILGKQVLSYHQMHKRWGMPQGLKIILTTDQDLIKYGVQAINDEFLEWFVKNPSCEEVEIEVDLSKHNGQFQTKYGYKIIIPKEEPKQLTDLEIAIKLEEIEREEVRAVNRTDLYNSILSIVKQIPRENVERDAMDAPSCAYEIEQLFYKWQEPKIETLEEAAEQFKKK